LALAVAQLTRALQGRADTRALDRVTRAVVDLPNAAIRRHARDGGTLPAWLARDVAQAARVLLQP
jgi:hypothetical protein